MIVDLIEAAKTWRGMARLVVLVVAGEEGATQEVAVDLGAARRRWKRVAKALEPIGEDLLGARGFNAEGALVGSWDAPDEDEGDEDPVEPGQESDEHAAHRAHTQWCLREAARMHEGSTRLTIELVTATIEIVRALRTSVAAPAAAAAAPGEDESTKTLGLLLQSFMASQGGNNNNKGEDHEAIRDEGRKGSHAGGQGSQGEPDPVGT